MATNNTTCTDDTIESVTLLPVIKFILVLLLRIGSLLIQLGTFPTDNVYNIITQNVIDFSFSLTSFLLMGFTLASGKEDWKGLIGYSKWIGSNNVKLAEVVTGVSACLIGSHVITSQLSGRLHAGASMVISTAYSGVILPVVMHWVWNAKGWMRNNNFLGANVTLTDHGGGLVVHAAAGMSGFVGMLFLGGRLLRLKDIDESSLGVGSPGLTIMGYLLVIPGLIAMTLPDELTHIDGIMINNLIAISLGMFTLVIIKLLSRKELNYWDLLRCTQGGISALIAISSGVNNYHALATVIISFFSGIVFALTSKIIYISPMEDYCNTLSSHAFSGILGIIAQQLFNPYRTILWQITCLNAILVLHVIIFSTLFSVLLLCGILRNRSDTISHTMSRNLRKATNGPCCSRIFDIDEGSTILQPGHIGKAIERSTTNVDVNVVSNSSLVNFESVVLEHGEYDRSQKNSSKKDKSVFTVRNNDAGDHAEETSLAAGDCSFFNSDDESVIYKIQDLMVVSNCTSV